MTSHHSDGENASVRHTRLAVLDRAVQRLEDADRTAPRRTAEWILIDVLNCNRAQLYAHPNQRVSSEDVDNFLEMITRRVRGEPLQHILGYASFYGLELEVSPGVMIPRPETEEVVDRALGCLQNIDRPRVLDVGTGSGCIALALKQERPDSTVYACDVSREALDVARANADALQSDVRFVHGDVTAADSSEHMPSELDLLVSNPPYIPTSEAESLPAVVRDYDPEIALFTGDDPLRFYRVLSERALTLCVSGGAFVVEVHTDYFEEVTTLLRQKGLVDIDVDADMNDRPRVVWGFIPGAANE